MVHRVHPSGASTACGRERRRRRHAGNPVRSFSGRIKISDGPFRNTYFTSIDGQVEKTPTQFAADIRMG